MAYADHRELEEEIIKRHIACEEIADETSTAALVPQEGIIYATVMEEQEETVLKPTNRSQAKQKSQQLEPKQEAPLRTD